MKVYIELKETSQPKIYADAINTYQKGDFYCIYDVDKQVTKYPIGNIHKVRETYN